MSICTAAFLRVPSGTKLRALRGRTLSPFQLMSLRSVFRAPTDARLHSLKPTHSTHPIHLFLLGRPQESGPAEECDRVPAYGAEAAEDCAARHGCEWRETRKGQGVFAPSLRRSQIGCVSSSPCSHSSTVSFAVVVVVLVRF